MRDARPGILLVAGSGALVRGLFGGAPLTRFALASCQLVGPDGVLVLTYTPA